MASSSKVSVSATMPRAPVRSDLKEGDLFIYGQNTHELRMVPDPAMSSAGQHWIGKDILVGGPHAGMADDSHPTAPVVLMDVSAFPSTTQPGEVPK
jgi:hypothetical protein